MTRTLAKIITDSVSDRGIRLTTMEVEIPRIVLAEFNTHRVFSRNSASSRAIPVEKMLQRVVEDPYVPEEWGRNGRGMQAHGVLDEETSSSCLSEWLRARDHAVEQARRLLSLGVHKQTTNRLLEPFMWQTIVVTATEWDNFLNLRCHPEAHPAIQRTALAMREVLRSSTPVEGEWHLPFVDERDAELSLEEKIKVSIARCARVSYLTHDGQRDPKADFTLHDRLLASGHMSPFEHVARPLTPQDILDSVKREAERADVSPWITNPEAAKKLIPFSYVGNFRGWMQYRKTLPHESNVLGSQE